MRKEQVKWAIYMLGNQLIKKMYTYKYIVLTVKFTLLLYLYILLINNALTVLN